MMHNLGAAGCKGGKGGWGAIDGDNAALHWSVAFGAPTSPFRRSPPPFPLALQRPAATPFACPAYAST
jgi:hypothetical protein